MLISLFASVAGHGYFIQPSGLSSQLANKVNVPGLPCGEFATMPTPEEMAQAATVVRPGESVSVVWVVENSDGAGPMNIQFDPTGTGKFGGAGSEGNCTITQQVPGKLGNSLPTGPVPNRTPFELTFIVPQDLNCPNGCLMRISQADRQFGACAPVRTGQQTVMPPRELQLSPADLVKLQLEKQKELNERNRQKQLVAPAIKAIIKAADADKQNGIFKLSHYNHIKELENKEANPAAKGTPAPRKISQLNQPCRVFGVNIEIVDCAEGLACKLADPRFPDLGGVCVPDSIMTTATSSVVATFTAPVITQTVVITYAQPTPSRVPQPVVTVSPSPSQQQQPQPTGQQPYQQPAPSQQQQQQQPSPSQQQQQQPAPQPSDAQPAPQPSSAPVVVNDVPAAGAGYGASPSTSPIGNILNSASSVSSSILALMGLYML